MRLFFFVIVIIISTSGIAQDVKQQFHVGLNLVVPDYEPLFRENFDGRPGAHLQFRRIYPKNIALGIGAETYSVRAITDNKNSFNVTEAAFYSGFVAISYNIINKPKTYLAPVIETGFTYVNYNMSEPSNFTGKLGIGLRFQYFMESFYGLELGINYFTLMTPFSPESFPANNTNMRFIMAKLGFTFDLSRKD